MLESGPPVQADPRLQIPQRPRHWHGNLQDVKFLEGSTGVSRDVGMGQVTYDFTIFLGSKHPLATYFRVPFGDQGFDHVSSEDSKCQPRIGSRWSQLINQLYNSWVASSSQPGLWLLGWRWDQINMLHSWLSPCSSPRDAHCGHIKRKPSWS